MVSCIQKEITDSQIESFQEWLIEVNESALKAVSEDMSKRRDFNPDNLSSEVAAQWFLHSAAQTISHHLTMEFLNRDSINVELRMRKVAQWSRRMGGTL